MKEEGAELAALLDKAKEKGPFILVGHSYGGLLTRLYAVAPDWDQPGSLLVHYSNNEDRLGVTMV